MDAEGLGAVRVTRTQWLAECTVPRVPRHDRTRTVHIGEAHDPRAGNEATGHTARESVGLEQEASVGRIELVTHGAAVSQIKVNGAGC